MSNDFYQAGQTGQHGQTGQQQGQQEQQGQEERCGPEEQHEQHGQHEQHTQHKNGNEDAGASHREPSEGGPEERCGSEDPNRDESDAALLRKENEELRDNFLRKAAEFENFRKRMNKEKQEAIDYANRDLLLDIIQIIDDFERAIKSAEISKDFSSLYEGITMIEKRLSSQLENKWGLKRFDSAGEPFDPNRHEAIGVEKSPDVSEAVVQEDFIKGYTLKERVIRAAKVKVLMPDRDG